MKRSILFGICSFILVLVGVSFWGISRNDIPHTIAVNGECLTTAPRDKTAIT